jgi:hypothetical protein
MRRISPKTFHQNAAVRLDLLAAVTEDLTCAEFNPLTTKVPKGAIGGYLKGLRARRSDRKSHLATIERSPPEIQQAWADFCQEWKLAKQRQGAASTRDSRQEKLGQIDAPRAVVARLLPNIPEPINGGSRIPALVDALIGDLSIDPRTFAPLTHLRKLQSLKLSGCNHVAVDEYNRHRKTLCTMVGRHVRALPSSQSSNFP